MGATLRIILFAWILLLGSLPGSFAHAPAKITARSLPQAIRGEADPNATITISPPAAVSRYGRDAGNTGPFFSAYVTRPVASTNAFISITNKASRPPMANVPAVSATNITQVYIPTNNYITYDEAGNTKSDGRWVYSWDAYNRLTKVESKPGAPVDSMRSLSFTYDAFGRRIGRVVSVADANGVYQESDHRKYVYHGWKLVAELNGTNNAVIRSYAWAQNMLLAIRQANRTYIPTFDGNGNVMTLVDNQTGAIAARYEYSPYGMLLKATGPMAMENPIRYSSEYQDDVTGFIYYGYRYLNPATQTWLSRDPIGMAGGFNLYALVDNDPVNGRDYLGLSTLSYLCGEGWKGAGAEAFDQSFAQSLRDLQVDALKRSAPIPLAPLVEPAVELRDQIIGWIEGKLHSFRESVAENGKLLSQGLYDTAMGETPGIYNEFSKGHLDGQMGVVDIDRNNNVLRDVLGDAGELAARTAEALLEAAVVKKGLEIVCSNPSVPKGLVNPPAFVRPPPLLPNSSRSFVAPAAKTAPTPTRFINGVKVTDRATGNVLEGTVDLKPTLDRISSGQPFPHRNDGGIFQNRPLPGRTTPELPAQSPGYYREYVHPTPGVNGPGPQRIVVGQGGEMYYTPDHYGTFIPINPR